MNFYIFLLTVIFMTSPAFADDHLYTNKDLEKYKMPSHTILQPSDNSVNKPPQAKKVPPSRKRHRKEKRMHYAVPSKNRGERINCQLNGVVWPQDMQTK